MTPYAQPEIIVYSKRLADSYRHWTGRALISPQRTDAALAEALYRAPFALLSHGTQPDPVFCYANAKAQELWDMPWQNFIAMPSRLSAQPDAQQDRQRLLDQAARQGYADNYQGVRITSGGRRFRIDNCLLWNVINEKGDKIGQAATFSAWHWL